MHAKEAMDHIPALTCDKGMNKINNMKIIKSIIILPFNLLNHFHAVPIYTARHLFG